ncbi:hypothetical protein [Bdellovibrio bacteriovorus]|nr:hypothetical protein [Bdellovibrio bacteriovorus]
MKKVLLATVLILNFSAFHAHANLLPFAQDVSVGDYSVAVSKIKFSKRADAGSFCHTLGKQLGLNLKLADLEEVIQVAAFGKPQLDSMMVQIKKQDGSVDTAIVAWDNKKKIKIDKENPANVDTHLVLRIRGGDGVVRETTLKELKELGAVDYQNRPIDKLPAFCIHDIKKQ